MRAYYRDYRGLCSEKFRYMYYRDYRGLCYDLQTASVTAACAKHYLHYRDLCYLQMGTIGKPHMARPGFTFPTSTTDQCESSTTNTVLLSGVVLRRGCKPSPHGDKQATSVSANKWYGGPDTVGQCVKSRPHTPSVHWRRRLRHLIPCMRQRPLAQC